MKLRIIQNGDTDNPREWSNQGTIVYKHSRYLLGDEQTDDPIWYLINLLDIEEKLQSSRKWHELNNETDMLDYVLTFFEKEYIFLPVYLYDHSGLALNTTGFSCRWDSGQIGWIYVSKADIRKEYNVKRISKKLREQIEANLNSEIELFEQYITGDVYGFVLEDNDENEIDSCWGFFGTDFENNGMKDHLPEEAHELLANFDLTDIEYPW